MRTRDDIRYAVGTLLRAHDHPDGELARAARRGDVLRVAPGRYAPVAAAHLPPWEEERRLTIQRALAVGQGLRPGFAITGPHAVALHGGPLLGTRTTVHVLGPGTALSTRGATYFARHRRSLEEQDVVTVHGSPVTSIARTAVECGRLLPLDIALPLVDGLLHSAAQASMWEPEESRLRLGAVVRDARGILDRERHLRGNPAARLILTLTDGMAENILESQGRRLAYVLGWPPASLQERYEVDGRTYFPDLTWHITVDGRLYVIHLECDGLSKYEGGSSLEAERDRHNALESLGHVVLRLTRPQIQRDGLANLWRQMQRKVPAEVLATLKARPALATPGEASWLRRQRLA